MIKRIILLVYFSFYKVFASVNDNLNQAHLGALMFTAILYTLVMFNMAIFIEKLFHIIIIGSSFAFIVFTLIIGLIMYKSIFLNVDFRLQIDSMNTMSFKLKLMLFVLSILIMIGLWILVMYQLISTSQIRF